MKTVYIVIKKVAYTGTEILDVFDNHEQALRCCNEYQNDYSWNNWNDAVRYMICERVVRSQ